MRNIDLLIASGVDINSSLGLLGDMEMYNETIDEFVKEIDEKLINIQKYKEIGDMANYAILVHSLKSDAKYLGFTKLAELAYNHEMESKANNIEYINNNYESLMEETSKILTLTKNYCGVAENIKEVKKEKVILNSRTLLVVDDSNLVGNFVQKVVGNDYEVVIVNDGEKALDIIKANLSFKIVGVLLDLNMPKVSGYEVLDFFKNNDLFKKIPVSIITGDNSESAIGRAKSYPIMDILIKPFNERDIKRVVEATINRQRQI